MEKKQIGALIGAIAVGALCIGFAIFAKNGNVDLFNKKEAAAEDLLEAEKDFGSLIIPEIQADKIFDAGIVNVDKLSADELPDYMLDAYVVVNKNKPSFTEDQLKTDEFVKFSDLDSKGRCQVATACFGKIIEGEKPAVTNEWPTGWQSTKYDLIDGEYIYNRCRLISYEFTNKSVDKKNLMTGTRFFNTLGLAPFENLVAAYVKNTNKHVLYRVTPYFKGDELVARGVQIEAMSVEDKGAGLSFNVYCFNVQPGIAINYENGESGDSAGNTGSIEIIFNGEEPAPPEGIINPGGAPEPSPDDGPGISENEPSPSSGGGSGGSVIIGGEGEQIEVICDNDKFVMHLSTCSLVSSIGSNKTSYFGAKATLKEALSQLSYKPCDKCFN